MRLDEQITLGCGAYGARLCAGAGARLTALTWHDGERDRDLLVPCAADAPFDPHDWPKGGAFPMAPFTNKLANGQFQWNGHTVVLPTPKDSPHALHGLAHRVPWTLSHATRERAVLGYSHQAGSEGWPWAFALSMEVALSVEGVQVDLQIRNLSSESMPAGLGWHPFHPACAGAQAVAGLSLQAAAIRDVGPQGLAVLKPVPERGPLHDIVIQEHTPRSTVFEHWGGTFSVALAKDLAVDVEAAGAAHLFCHVPSQTRHVCLEPVTLLPGALQHYDAAMRAACIALEPGATRALRWRCSARSVP